MPLDQPLNYGQNKQNLRILLNANHRYVMSDYANY